MIVALIAAVGTLQIGSTSASPSANPMPGAIFTTLPDGSVVNENIGYGNKCEVSLNGGSSHPQAHHLSDGIYDVAVTDPSGKVVLGKGNGVVVIANGEGSFGPTSLCDLVKPSPYETTPNPGLEYKAWLCEEGSLFINRSCKTDNFKVRLVVPSGSTSPPTSEPTPEPTPVITPSPEATPTVTPVASSIVLPPPVMPSALPDSGGEPPEKSSPWEYILLGSGALMVTGGYLFWRHRRGIL